MGERFCQLVPKQNEGRFFFLTKDFKRAHHFYVYTTLFEFGADKVISREGIQGSTPRRGAEEIKIFTIFTNALPSIVFTCVYEYYEEYDAFMNCF